MTTLSSHPTRTRKGRWVRYVWYRKSGNVLSGLIRSMDDLKYGAKYCTHIGVICGIGKTRRMQGLACVYRRGWVE